MRKLLFSPHSDNIVLSCSYDMTVKLWNVAAPEDALLRSWDQHTEFVVGIDFSTLVEGQVASTGWDELTYASPLVSSPSTFRNVAGNYVVAYEAQQTNPISRLFFP